MKEDKRGARRGGIDIDNRGIRRVSTASLAASRKAQKNENISKKKAQKLIANEMKQSHEKGNIALKSGIDAYA